MGPERGGGPLIKHALRLRERDDAPGRHEICPIPEELSFDKGFYLFVRSLQMLKAAAPEGVTLLVGLAGPSGSGKTVFSEKVNDFIPNCAVLSLDMYNDASRLVDGNFDDPRLTDYDTLLANLEGLRSGNAVDVPVYDFKQSKRVGYHRQEVPGSGIVIVEGIYALSDRLRPLLDLRVSVTGGVHFDLVKRVLRDIKRSGQAPAEIISQISETVYPMYKAFIEPDLQTAHLKIVNQFNPFQGFQNPTFILKSDKPVSEEEILSLLDEGDIERSEQSTIDIYLLPPNEDPETCQSWLRMRNRDGHYTLMFEEFVTDGSFIVSPRIKFEVSVKILGGLMALGYTMGTVMKRSTVCLGDNLLSVKLDQIQGVDRRFVQIQGKVRAAVEEAGRKLGLEGTYIPRSYIEMVQLEELQSDFGAMDEEEIKTRFSLDLQAPPHVQPFDGARTPSPAEQLTNGLRAASPAHATLSSRGSSPELERQVRSVFEGHSALQSKMDTLIVAMKAEVDAEQARMIAAARRRELVVVSAAAAAAAFMVSAALVTLSGRRA